MQFNYLAIYPNWINIDDETINSSEGPIETSVFYRGLLLIFHKTTAESKQNVFAIDLKKKKFLWKIQKNPNSERDHLNPYNGLLSKLCTSDYIVLSKSDSWKVAVDPETGKIRTDVDLNTGHRPW